MKTASGAYTAADARATPANVSRRCNSRVKSLSGITYAIAGRLARTRKLCTTARVPLKRHRARLYAARKAVPTVKSVAVIDTMRLVAYTRGKPGTWVMTSAYLSADGGSVHAGGHPFASGLISNEARRVQMSGTISAKRTTPRSTRRPQASLRR